MFNDNFSEHLAHSAYDHAEAFAGFDRGDLDFQCRYYFGSFVFGRMRSESGSLIELVCEWSDYDGMYNECFHVQRNKVKVSPDFDKRSEAVACGRWWLDGCPA